MRSRDIDDGIDDYLLGRMAPGEREDFEIRLFQHPEDVTKIEEREALIAAVKGLPEMAAGAAREQRPRFLAWLFRAPAARPWAAAAAVLIVAAAIGIGLLSRPGRRPPELVFSGDQTVRGPSLVLVGPAGDVPAAPEALEWRPLPGAAEYRVTLTDVGEIWSATVKATRAALPAEVRARLVPGRTYTWRVKAYTPQGALASASKPTGFRIAG